MTIQDKIAKIVVEIEREKNIPERSISRFTPEGRKVFRTVVASDDRVFNLRHEADKAFGTQYGWRLGKSFGLECLVKGGVPDNYGMPIVKFVDHFRCYCFNRKAAALLCHIYVPPFEEHEFYNWSKSQKLTMYLPDIVSWYSKSTRLVVYVGPVGMQSLGLNEK